MERIKRFLIFWYIRNNILGKFNKIEPYHAKMACMRHYVLLGKEKTVKREEESGADWKETKDWVELKIKRFYRSSPPEVFFGKDVQMFIKIAQRHGCSTVNLLHIFRIPFYKNTYEELFLFLSFALTHIVNRTFGIMPKPN